ncbi:NAD(P)/FAD-dependent oxidoreductase [Amorphus sp. MBR-141]
METPNRIVVVGASAAGVSAVEALRAAGYAGRLTLVGAERGLPYDRPPLSKHLLAGAWEPERLLLRPAERYREIGVETRFGMRATGLDPQRRTIELETGDEIAFDGLIIATGASAIRLPLLDGLGGAYLLRTLDDALALQTLFRTGPRLAIVGAGFLGAEAAAVARSAGLEVTLIDPAAAPLAVRLGSALGAKVAELHRGHGVDLKMGVQVRGAVRSGNRVVGLELSDGTTSPCDAVIVAVGSRPDVDWLRSSGLPLGNGVECDCRCRAAEGIYAAGDVASWMHRGYGARIRIEHRSNAAEQAAVAARNLLGADEDFVPVPYFWSDQYDVKLQAYGLFPPGAEVHYLHGTPGSDCFVMAYTHEGRVTGAVGWNAPRPIRDAYAMLKAQMTPESLFR